MNVYETKTMAQQLSGIRVIILRKCGKLLRLSDIMENCRSQQQIPIQDRIMIRKIIAKLYHAERMLQKASHKSVMYTFGR